MRLLCSLAVLLLSLPASALVVTLNGYAESSLTTAVADDESDIYRWETLRPQSVPFSSSSTTTDLGSSATSEYDLSSAGFTITFEHARGADYSISGSIGYVYFSLDRDVHYSVAGSYAAADPEGRSFNLGAELYDPGAGSYLFFNGQQSRLTPDESFTLGLAEGDSLNNLIGSPTGTLVAGRDYWFSYNANIGWLPSAASSVATAMGSISLAFTPIPEPGTAILVSTGLIALAVRRRGRGQDGVAQMLVRWRFNGGMPVRSGRVLVWSAVLMLLSAPQARADVAALPVPITLTSQTLCVVDGNLTQPAFPPVCTSGGSSVQLDFQVGLTSTATGSITAENTGGNLIYTMSGTLSGNIQVGLTVEQMITFTVPGTVIAGEVIPATTLAASLTRDPGSSLSGHLFRQMKLADLEKVNYATSAILGSTLQLDILDAVLRFFPSLSLDEAQTGRTETLGAGDQITATIRPNYRVSQIDGSGSFEETFTYELRYLPEPSPPLALGLGAGLLAMLGRER